MIELGAQRGCKKSGDAIHTIVQSFAVATDTESDALFLSKLKLLNEKGMLTDEEKAVIVLHLPQKYKSMAQEFAVSEKGKEKIDALRLKKALLQEKIGEDVGKTNQYSDETAKTHIKTAKQVMKFKNSKRGEAEI